MEVKGTDDRLNWKQSLARAAEDRMLLTHVAASPGLYFTEVPVGFGPPRGPWTDGAAGRRIDAVRIRTRRRTALSGLVRYGPATAAEFRRLIEGCRAEVLEVKRVLNRTVIGQALVGARLLEIEYEPRRVSAAVLVSSRDAALETACRDLKVHVYHAQA